MTSDMERQYSNSVEVKTVPDKRRIFEAVQRAINAINQCRARDEAIGTSSETVLIGETGTLDSLGLISLLVAVEQEIDKEFGVELSLSEEEELFLGDGSSLKSINSLVDHISARMGS